MAASPESSPGDQATAGSADAVNVLMAGAAILAAVLVPYGFTFQRTREGRSSGGGFATARFIKSNQYLEFHFRNSLGLITYGWDGATLSHADYLRGLKATGAYPGYSHDPLEGFRHLAQDLAGPLRGFRDGDRHGYDAGLAAARQPASRHLP